MKQLEEAAKAFRTRSIERGVDQKSVNAQAKKSTLATQKAAAEDRRKNTRKKELVPDADKANSFAPFVPNAVHKILDLDGTSRQARGGTLTKAVIGNELHLRGVTLQKTNAGDYALSKDAMIELLKQKEGKSIIPKLTDLDGNIPTAPIADLRGKRTAVAERLHTPSTAL